MLTTNFALLTVRNAMDFHYRNDMANINVTSGMIKDNPFLPQAGHPLLGYWEGFTIFLSVWRISFIWVLSYTVK